MSDNAQVLEKLGQLLGQFQAAGAAGGGVGAAMPSPAGVAVPIEIDTPMGQVTLYVTFPPEALQNPHGLIQAVMAQGLRVRAFQPRFGGGGPRRFFGNGGGGGGWQGGGGYGGPRGGGWQGGGGGGW